MIHIFLSASIPLPGRDPRYLETVDNVAVRDSIKSLISAALEEATVTFGGHPAITPLIAMLLRGLPNSTRRRVVLYQSAFFEDQFIEENDEFIDLKLTEKIPGDLPASIRHMREEMMSSQKFDAAFFVGGMEGIWEEYKMFKKYHPTALCLPIGSTGAAARDLCLEIGDGRPALLNELTYPTLFRDLFEEIKRVRIN